jgi:outer membrane protein assembly factor BamB
MYCCSTTRYLALGLSIAVGLAAAIGIGSAISTQPASADEPAVKVKGAEPVKPTAGKSDLSSFGGGPSRNMVNLLDKGLPDKPDPNDVKILKWKADLGSRAYGGPIIASGKVFVGTNNEKPRNPRDQKKNADGDVEPLDKGNLMCFDEKTGEYLWQAVHDKLPSGQVNDWPKEGVCATPLVDGDRVYYTTNRCTVICLDVNGMKDGNQGIQTEKYQTATDADVIWELDMIKELGVFPHNMTAASPLLVGDILFVVTANGVDENHINIPAPQAPSFIAVDKKTGKVLWQRNDPGKNIMHGQWANPAYTEVAGTKMVIFPGGDGWIYAFTPEKGELIWKFDANPKDTQYDLGGAGTKSDFIGTPVIADGMCYIGTGQDPEHFTGIAHFYCIDLKKAVENAKKNKDQDVSPELVAQAIKGDDGKMTYTGKPNPDSAVAWHYGGKDPRKFVPRDFVFGRTMSTACVIDGIVYISELQGQIHCLDAKTGKKFWQYDTKSAIWGSPYYVDGRIYLATESGEVFVFRHLKDQKVIDELDNPAAEDQKSFNNQLKTKRKQVEDTVLIGKVEFDAPVRSTVVAANGTLYVMTEKTMYAFEKK